jgi:hypothetical protein
MPPYINAIIATVSLGSVLAKTSRLGQRWALVFRVKMPNCDGAGLDPVPYPQHEREQLCPRSDHSAGPVINERARTRYALTATV